MWTNKAQHKNCTKLVQIFYCIGLFPTKCFLYLHITLARIVRSYLHAAHHMLLHLKSFKTLHRPIKLQAAIALYIYIQKKVKQSILKICKNIIYILNSVLYKIWPLSIWKLFSKSMVNQPNLTLGDFLIHKQIVYTAKSYQDNVI